MRAGFVKVAAILLAVLREVFDEAAYARFLARTRQTASRASYQQFLGEQQQVRARRPRCC